MDDTAKAFVERQNIAHYVDQLKPKPILFSWNAPAKLLAEEEASRSEPQLDFGRASRPLSPSLTMCGHMRNSSPQPLAMPGDDRRYFRRVTHDQANRLSLVQDTVQCLSSKTFSEYGWWRSRRRQISNGRSGVFDVILRMRF